MHIFGQIPIKAGSHFSSITYRLTHILLPLPVAIASPQFRRPWVSPRLHPDQFRLLKQFLEFLFILSSFPSFLKQFLVFLFFLHHFRVRPLWDSNHWLFIMRLTTWPRQPSRQHEPLINIIYLKKGYLSYIKKNNITLN